MNKGNTKYLLDNFSFFGLCFGNKRVDPFTFQCEDGWFVLLKDLCEKLQGIDLKEVQVNCVKEKFGELRFYILVGANEGKDKMKEAFRLVAEATDKSKKICERCGADNAGLKRKLKVNIAQVKTLCEACAGSDFK